MTAEEFKKLREYLGKNQTEFAEFLGYTNQVIISYKESGARGITRRDEIMLAPIKKKMDTRDKARKRKLKV